MLVILALAGDAIVDGMRQCLSRGAVDLFFVGGEAAPAYLRRSFQL